MARRVSQRLKTREARTSRASLIKRRTRRVRRTLSWPSASLESSSRPISVANHGRLTQSKTETSTETRSSVNHPF